MATGIVSNQRNASGFKKQNLPNIEHPMSRLGDRISMNVTGSNRPDSVMSPRARQNSSGREARTPPLAQAGRASVVGLHAWDEPDHNLPPLQKDGGKENKRSKKQKHSRMMTWPPGNVNGSKLFIYLSKKRYCIICNSIYVNVMYKSEWKF